MSVISLLEICKALSNNEFVFFYQPIISLVTGRIAQAEALIRWRRADGSIVPPSAFLPICIEKGFITEITRDMFPKLVDDLVQISAYDPSMVVTFNLTSQDMETDHLAGWMKEQLTQKGLSPNRVSAEIVESVLMPPTPKIRETIFDFARENIPLVLDDFSAGNTSVQYLSQLPLSMIKLSLEVVKEAPVSQLDFRILRHLVSMGHQLRLDVVAEGVENREIYDLVLSIGCTYAQGYHFYRPLALPGFLEVVKSQPRWMNYPFGLEYLAQIDHIDFRRDVIREAMVLLNFSDDEIRQRAIDRLPMLDHTDCLLGKWYTEIRKEHPDAHDSEGLGAVHEQFHLTAKAILAAAKQNEPMDVIEKLISTITNQSNEIMKIIQELATRKILEHYQSENSE